MMQLPARSSEGGNHCFIEICDLASLEGFINIPHQDYGPYFVSQDSQSIFF